MNKQSQILIFLVDDDALYLRGMEIEFQQLGKYTIVTFNSGEDCLKALEQHPDIIILDFNLNSIIEDNNNGLQILDQIKAYNPKIEVIMLSGQDKIDIAIECMHHKALDYVVKSETAFLRLQKIILNLLHFKKMEHQLNWYVTRM